MSVRSKITPEYLREINDPEDIPLAVLEVRMTEVARRGRPATGCHRYEVDMADFLPKIYTLSPAVIAELTERGFKIRCGHTGKPTWDTDQSWEVSWEPDDHNAEYNRRHGLKSDEEE